MKRDKILYWPGRGQSLDVLRKFREELRTRGFELECIHINYDEGELKPHDWKQVAKNNADWWIGISLGASLLYYSLKFAKRKPKRITLINPFSSREVLSRERKFNLENQWNFAPIDCAEKVDSIDMILSTNDIKIPMYHGVKIINKTICRNKQIIFIDENHTIDNENAQKELVTILINDYRGREDNERNNYCNVYKQ